MIFERSDVQFPLWRKKVGPVIATARCDNAPVVGLPDVGIQEDFQGVESRTKPEGPVRVRLAGVNGIQEGWVTCLTKGRGNALFRLFLDETAKRWLRRAYPMTHLRAIETVLAGQGNQVSDVGIPSWEFLDIEYDRNQKEFLFDGLLQAGADVSARFRESPRRYSD